MTTATLCLLTPEIVLIAAAVAIYLGGAFSDNRRAWTWIAGLAVAAAAAPLWMQQQPAAASGPLYLDALNWHGRWFALGFGAIMVLFTARPLSTSGTSEYAGSLLLTVAGLMLVVASGELVLLFVGLELISIPTYLLLYLGRSDVECQESTVKYFFLSVLSSAILLYGFSFLYGVAGSTEFSAVRAVLEDAKNLPTGFAAFAKLAWALVFAGLCFKIAAVPLHFYAPDVYQGTTYPNAALLSVVPKAAGFVLMVRILVMAMPGMEPYAWRVALVISLLSMTLGNVMALWQDDLRRLLAYSSIANAGYMLIGLAASLATGDAAGPWNGISALAFYLVAYAAATTGAFAVLEHLGRPDRRIDGVEELAGLGRTRPLNAAMLAVCLLSLTGVPPLAGFWGKLWLFGSALNVDGAQADASLRWWFVGLAIVGVLNAAVAAAYYLRVVAVMYFRTPLATPRSQGGAGVWWAAVLCTLLVVAVGLYPGPLMREADCIRVQDSGIETQGKAVGCVKRTDPNDSWCVSRTLRLGREP
jgi:NADH-quinone oxidoreductase subunit N